MKRDALAVALLFIASPALAQAPDPVVAADHAGSAATPAKPSDALDNPVTSPLAAWDDAKAAKKTSWPLAVWAVLAMLGKALAYGREKLKGLPGIGWLARRLAVGKTAMIVAGVGAVGAAGYDVLASGGSIVAALVASGVAIAGALHSTTKGAE